MPCLGGTSRVMSNSGSPVCRAATGRSALLARGVECHLQPRHAASPDCPSLLLSVHRFGSSSAMATSNYDGEVDLLVNLTLPQREMIANISWSIADYGVPRLPAASGESLRLGTRAFLIRQANSSAIAMRVAGLSDMRLRCSITLGIRLGSTPSFSNHCAKVKR